MSAPRPLVGILLAAGSGRRFGGDKLLHPLADGTPMAVAAARRLRQCCPETVAVLRPESAALARLLAGEGCVVVYASDAASGMGHSLAAGVGAAPDAAGWLVALADMPFIAPASYRRVAEALRAGAGIAAPTCARRRGHPVGFAARWQRELAALSGDSGARSLLAAHPEAIVLCETGDPGILRDIDTRADLDA